jgi:putative ABC transport system ATP-binding protein
VTAGQTGPPSLVGLGDLPEGAAVVDLDGVAKTYPGVRPVEALRPCTLRIAGGEYVAVVGPSGSGKSTLMNLLGLIDTPTAGTYRFRGIDVSTMKEAQRCGLRAHHIGFVFQSFHLVGYRTAVENVESGLLYQRVSPKVRRQRAEAVLERVGLTSRMWATPPELSGGERQRVAIARALVRQPALVLCDEPTGNLDSETGTQVLELLAGLHRDGVTIVVITHDPIVASRAQRVIEIRDGVLTRSFAVTDGLL